MNTLRLHPGKERSLQRKHPWIFASAIARGDAGMGETVRVVAHDGRFLAWAAYSPHSQIRARVWSFDESARIDAPYFPTLCQHAITARQRLGIDSESDAVRLIHGESDGLPGLVVDRYGSVLVAQFLSAGAERWKDAIADALLASTGLHDLYERSDTSNRALEGLPPCTGWLRGGTGTTHVIREHGWTMALDIATGHKTGYYIDQRNNRLRFAQYARLRGFDDVLNTYCYTGGFTVAALHGGARHVTSVDSSGEALALAQDNIRRNSFAEDRCTWIEADVNTTMRRFLDARRRFDAIVLDPPKFAPTVRHADKAARAYKDIHRIAFQLLRPQGVLFGFSCSSGIGVELFHKIVASASADAGVECLIVERLGAGADHPISTAFPEGEYLKGLVLIRRD
ncbi:class I SAM-dependent rRNA methyltransferase [Candidatus Symbiobacter mobilis]|uniref:SAM-dependent methyltransferase-like protein n=1 Tax=Candidatus Symbiobacter mobilis CR TaxID=946483 RepID=U5N7N5_9BURK|nr:class I SAM-dependent methyltransferase [Candidatus Symbiobacter mobilis]AGX86303.1 SAM-dependent methyltransferase-like protein [Candidatus Symbiobacter mobilis CR]